MIIFFILIRVGRSGKDDNKITFPLFTSKSYAITPAQFRPIAGIIGPMTEELLKSEKDYVAPRLRGRPGRTPPEESAAITRKITALAMAVGLFFAVTKFFIWKETHSIGILSSLIHSALDLFASFSTFIAVRYAVRKPTDNYRYGHGKAESFAALLQVLLIIIAALHLFEEAISHLGNPEPVQQSVLAICAMVLFIFVSTWLLIAQSWAIRETGSIAIKGDRAHYLADMVANLFVIAGIVFVTYTPFKRADPHGSLASIHGIPSGSFSLGTAHGQRIARGRTRHDHQARHGRRSGHGSP